MLRQVCGHCAGPECKHLRSFSPNLLFFVLLSVVGIAKQIEWFGPSGDRIEPNRPDITVTRNDESSSTLTLYKAKMENEGTYKCVATTGDQQGESTVKVKIFRKFFFFFSTHAPKLLIGLSEGEKNPVYWTHSISLTAQGQHITLFFSSEDGFFISSINGGKTIRGLLNDPVCCAGSYE